MRFFKDQISHLQANLETLDNQPLKIYEKAETGMRITKDTLHIFRKKVLECGFKNQEMECLFFKTIKPKVVEHIVHFINLVNLERNRSYGLHKQHLKFCENYISNLQTYFFEHREFYEYYLRGLTHRDKEFFLRKSGAVELHHDSISSIVDYQFSTTHDMVLANILGNSRTIKYLQKGLINDHRENTFKEQLKEKTTKLRWTGAKVDLVELIYALHASGLINNGNVDIKVLASKLELLFSLKVGDFYRKFIEIRDRKNNRTKLLDLLKTGLINKMIQADN